MHGPLLCLHASRVRISSLKGGNDSDNVMSDAELFQTSQWKLSMDRRRQEAEMVIFDCVEKLLDQNKMQPCQVCA